MSGSVAARFQKEVERLREEERKLDRCLQMIDDESNKRNVTSDSLTSVDTRLAMAKSDGNRAFEEASAKQKVGARHHIFCHVWNLRRAQC